MQYVEKTFMEVDYNMLIQNHVHYNYVVKKITLWGGVQWLKTWLFNVEVRNSNPHIYNLGYFGYSCDQIR
jgi:hypothetical protein